ncbi:MAG: 50S ribosomal protein L24 [Thermoplasmata archaeon]
MSEKARKQRKKLENAPNHKRRKIMSATLNSKLRERHQTRSLPVVKGDEVEVMRGSFKGHIDKVAKVDRRSYRVYIEGVTVQKADEAKVPYGIHSSNLRIVKLNLSDPLRKEKIQQFQKEGSK